MIFRGEGCQSQGEHVGGAWGCGYSHYRLSAIMERFDEVDLSGSQVPSNDSIATSGSHDASLRDAKSHDTRSHDTRSHDISSHNISSRDTRSHDTTTSSTSKHLPTGKPPSGGGMSKVDTHRVTGLFIYSLMCFIIQSIMKYATA